MIIGSLGDIVFSASSDLVHTLDDISTNVSASFGSHKLVGGKTILEYTGSDPGQITFTLPLSAFLGADPAASIDALESLAASGSPVTFVLGSRIFGRWVITRVNADLERLFKDGALMSAKVKVTLKEYAG